MKSLFLFLCLSLSTIAFSQYDMDAVENDKEKESNFSPYLLKQRIYVGGDFGLSFGPGAGYVLLSPLVGYDITERFSAGVSGMYQLFRQFGTNYYSYGGGVFARLRPIDQLILQTEFDLFNTNDFFTSGLPRVNVPAFLTGIGYAGGGSRTYYQALVMYDFIGNPNMPLPPFIVNRLYLKLGFIWHLGN